ncbi:MAG: hypothetical protein NHB32_06190 [Fischerella sp. CENA71]|nr:hypothetical protein [Fischerella sp. CENA71]
MATTKKITIVVPGSVHDDLSMWAEEEGRPLANLASYLIEQALRAKFPKKYPPAIKIVDK